MAQRKVLLIDYEPRSIEDTRRPLLEAGYEVEVAHDGVAGLEAFHRMHPDLVLVEAMLPKKHGFDVCQEIKQSDDGHDTPVVITTGVYRGRKYRNQALKNFGCDEYLEKPFTDDALLAACNRFIRDEVVAAASPAPAGASAADSPAAVVAPLAAPATLDLEKMTEDEISSRLDSLLADFGEAVDRAAAPEPASAPTPVGTSTPEIEARDAVVAGTETAARDPVPERIEDPHAIEAALASTPIEAAVAANPPLPAVKRSNQAPVPAVPGAAPAASEDLGALPEREVPTAPDLFAASSAPRPVSRGPWLMIAAIVGVAAVGGVVTWRMLGAGSDRDASSPPVSREPVTFDATLAREAGPGAFVPEAIDDGLGPATFEVATEDSASTGAIEPIRIAPASDPPPVGATPSTTTVDGRVPPSSSGTPSTPVVAETRPRETESDVTTRSTNSGRPAPAATATPSSASAPTADVAAVVSRPPTIETEPPPALSSTSPAPSEAPTRTEPVTVDGSLPFRLLGGTGDSPLAVGSEEEPALPEVRTATGDRVRRGAAPIEPARPAVRVGDLLPLTQVDVQPVVVEQPAPSYHPMARQLRQQGTVVLNVLIDETGTVTDVQVLREIPNSKLNDSAVKAVRKWRYEPATKDGKAVKVWKTEAIHFRL